MWPLFCLLWPPAAVVFALDGILIGAGDTRYLALAMVVSAAVYVPLALAALAFDWGIVGVWCALLALMGAAPADAGRALRGPAVGAGGGGDVAPPALPGHRLVHPPLHVELAVEVGLVGVAVLDAAAGEQLGERLDVVARRAACPRRAAAR